MAIFDLTKEWSKRNPCCLEFVCIEGPFQILLHDAVADTEDGVVQGLGIDRELISLHDFSKRTFIELMKMDLVRQA